MIYDIFLVLTYPAALLKGLFLPKLLHGVCHILYKDVHLKYMLMMTMVMFIGTMMTCRYISIVISPNFKCKSLLRSQCWWTNIFCELLSPLWIFQLVFVFNFNFFKMLSVFLPSCSNCSSTRKTLLETQLSSENREMIKSYLHENQDNHWEFWRRKKITEITTRLINWSLF